ncbi:ZIP family metal transporter [bacterium]|nr:MAG: ZIP family metal transporter [bacterium]
MHLFLILISTFIVSIVSLIGVVTLSIQERFLKAILFFLIAFSAGALLGGAFLHLIPEAIEKTDPAKVFTVVTVGFVLFFILEKYLFWHHCHDGVCGVHAFTYLNLIGDGLHNFMDGMVIAAGFASSVSLGVFTTIMVIVHEIPQELGDFGVLVYGGFSKRKALFCNFLSALAAFGGALAGYFLSNRIAGFSYILLALTAGGFIYIASADLVPEIHKEANLKKSIFSLAFFVFGIALMYILKGLA